MDGKELWSIRKNLGLSQFNFAVLIGYSRDYQSVLSAMENGRIKVPQHVADLAVQAKLGRAPGQKPLPPIRTLTKLPVWRGADGRVLEAAHQQKWIFSFVTDDIGGEPRPMEVHLPFEGISKSMANETARVVLRGLNAGAAMYQALTNLIDVLTPELKEQIGRDVIEQINSAIAKA